MDPRAQQQGDATMQSNSIITYIFYPITFGQCRLGTPMDIAELRSGHMPLNSFKYLMKKIDSPNCEDCAKRQDVYHLLVECVRSASMREELIKFVKCNHLDVGLFQSMLAEQTSVAANMLYRSIFDLLKDMVLEFVAAYGWYLVGAGIASAYLYNKLRPRYIKWKQAREDAEYHKNPDAVLAREEAMQRARQLQQERLLQASLRVQEQQREREEQKRAETAERMRKYGAAAGGQRLGSTQEYLPLSGGASGSSYRAPKKSKCGGGGCGR